MGKTHRNMDICFIVLLLNLFCALSFIYFNFNKTQVQDFFMLGILFIVIILSYFNGIIFGLIASALVIFLYATYILYKGLTVNSAVNISTYVWMVFIPFNAFISGRFSYYVKLMQDTNEKLQNEVKELITIDEVTGLNNLKSFYSDLNKQMSNSKRHKGSLSLMIIKLQYFNELLSLVGQKNMNGILKEVTNCVNSATRNEDIKYKISSDVLAVIMPNTDFKGAEVVKNRVKENVNEFTLKINEENKNINIDLKIGIVQYKDDIKNPFEFKDLGEKELEYDV